MPGSGMALLYASQRLDDLELDNLEQQVGVDAIKAAIRQPCIQVAQNAGVEGGVVIQTLLKGDDRKMGSNA